MNEPKVYCRVVRLASPLQNGKRICRWFVSPGHDLELEDGRGPSSVASKESHASGGFDVLRTTSSDEGVGRIKSRKNDPGRARWAQPRTHACSFGTRPERGDERVASPDRSLRRSLRTWLTRPLSLQHGPPRHLRRGRRAFHRPRRPLRRPRRTPEPRATSDLGACFVDRAGCGGTPGVW